MSEIVSMKAEKSVLWYDNDGNKQTKNLFFFRIMKVEFFYFKFLILPLGNHPMTR